MQIGISGVLGLIFITLKLMDVIAWSWWLVLLPIYGPLAIAGLLLMVALTITARRGNMW